MNWGYSFYINALKKFLFLFSFLLIILTFLNKSVNVLTDLKSSPEYDINSSQEILINPKFFGITPNPCQSIGHVTACHKHQLAPIFKSNG